MESIERSDDRDTFENAAMLALLEYPENNLCSRMNVYCN